MNFSLVDLLLDSAGSLTQLQEAHSRQIRIFLACIVRTNKKCGEHTFEALRPGHRGAFSR
jgi:hypothetical protein